MYITGNFFLQGTSEDWVAINSVNILRPQARKAIQYGWRM